MIRITNTLFIDENELQETFVRASGPGGQHVNKVATAVQLRFPLTVSKALSEPVKRRLIRLAGNRISEEGILMIRSDRFRSQRRNRQDARERLAALIRSALAPPRKRRKTRPSKRSVQRRLEHKRRRSVTKRMRKRVQADS
jgi:ribosome-associated protein